MLNATTIHRTGEWRIVKALARRGTGEVPGGRRHTRKSYREPESMSEAKKDEEITTLDSHAPVPPVDGPQAGAEDSHAPAPTTDGSGEITTLDSHAPSAPVDGPPIKPLDSHAP
jgi:hypothetical protein